MYDLSNEFRNDPLDLVGIDAVPWFDPPPEPAAAPGMKVGGVVSRVYEGRRQWLTRTTELFVETEWSWTFEKSKAFPFAGYGCAEAVAEILRRNGQGDCFAMVCKESA